MFLFVPSRSWSGYTTRSDIKFEKRETKPTAVGYPRSDFKICVPGRIITCSSDIRDPTLKKRNRETTKVVSTISDYSTVSQKNNGSIFGAIMYWVPFSQSVMWLGGGLFIVNLRIATKNLRKHLFYFFLLLWILIFYLGP